MNRTRDCWGCHETARRAAAGWLAPLAVGFCLLTAAAGCQQKMADQPSFKPLDPSPADPHGQSARKPVEGTVARGHLRVDWALYTGRTSAPVVPIAPTTGPGGNAAAGSNSAGSNSAGSDSAAARAQDGARATLAAELAEYRDVVDEFPLPVTAELIEHGKDRFTIYCAVCHDSLGTGHGKIVERGYTRPPSYHIDRLRAAPVGHLFRVVSEGYGAMPSYAQMISASDRWAIVAYVRALQLSQHFPEDQLTPEMRKSWQGSTGSASAAPASPTSGSLATRENAAP